MKKNNKPRKHKRPNPAAKFGPPAGFDIEALVNDSGAVMVSAVLQREKATLPEMTLIAALIPIGLKVLRSNPDAYAKLLDGMKLMKSEFPEVEGTRI